MLMPHQSMKMNVFKALFTVNVVLTVTHWSHAFSSSSFSFLAKSRSQEISSFGLLPLNAHDNNRKVSHGLKDFIERHGRDETFKEELGEAIDKYGEERDMLKKFLGTILKDGELDKSALEGNPKQFKGCNSTSGAGGGGTSTNNNDNEEADPKLNSTQLVARIEKDVKSEALKHMVVIGHTAIYDVEVLKRAAAEKPAADLSMIIEKLENVEYTYLDLINSLNGKISRIKLDDKGYALTSEVDTALFNAEFVLYHRPTKTEVETRLSKQIEKSDKASSTLPYNKDLVRK